MSKKKVNSFELFMGEVQRSEKLKNNFLKWGAELTAFADPLWKNLTESQRAQYKAQAKLASAEKKTSEPCLYTSFGESIADLNRAEKEKTLKKQKLEIRVNDFVFSEDFKNEGIFLISFNYFLESKHVPAEVSIVRVTIKSGVQKENVFHCFINPEKIICGYAFEAQQQFEKHGIPIPPDAMGSTYKQTIESINKFVEKYMECAMEFPVFYTLEQEIQPCINAMNLMYGSDHHAFEFSSVSQLLSKILTKKEQECSPLAAKIIFNKDKFLGSPNLGCEFHEAQGDDSFNCPLSKTTRWGFTILDHCCRYFDIKLIPGQHIPSDYV